MNAHLPHKVASPPGCPLNRQEVVDRYFLEHRAKLIDIAAFLDRVERAQPVGHEQRQDFRVAALLEAVKILRDGQPERARRILELFSDTSTELVERAPGKGATGASPWPGNGMGEGA